MLELFFKRKEETKKSIDREMSRLGRNPLKKMAFYSMADAAIGCIHLMSAGDRERQEKREKRKEKEGETK